MLCYCFFPYSCISSSSLSDYQLTLRGCRGLKSSCLLFAFSLKLFEWLPNSEIKREAHRHSCVLIQAVKKLAQFLHFISI